MADLVIHRRNPVEQLLTHSGFLALCESICWAEDPWLSPCATVDDGLQVVHVTATLKPAEFSSVPDIVLAVVAAVVAALVEAGDGAVARAHVLTYVGLCTAMPRKPFVHVGG